MQEGEPARVYRTDVPSVPRVLCGRRELLHASLQHLKVAAVRTPQQHSLKLSLAHLQIDSALTLKDSRYAVMLAPMPRREKDGAGGEEGTGLDEEGAPIDDEHEPPDGGDGGGCLQLDLVHNRRTTRRSARVIALPLRPHKLCRVRAQRTPLAQRVQAVAALPLSRLRLARHPAVTAAGRAEHDRAAHPLRARLRALPGPRRGDRGAGAAARAGAAHAARAGRPQ
eukprot:5436778-Prymnesium_polylepis.1